MREGREYKKLGEVATLINGFAFQSAMFQKAGLPIVRISTIQDDKITSDFVYFNRDDYNIDFEKYEVLYGDILIAMSGATTGKVGINYNDEVLYLNQRVGKIVPRENIIQRYLFYYLKTNAAKSLSIAQGVAQPNLSTQQINSFVLPVPPLSEQQRIVSELDLLSSIIEKKKAQLKEYDQLAQSIFYDMFGDPVTNEKGWEVEYFGDIASFKNGLNYHPKEDGFQIKCIGVGDFQDYRELRDFKLIKDYSIDEVIDESYYLKDGDIIIVRSNGSKELVGRNMIVYPQDKKVTYSGFCIRCRLNSSSILPVVLNRILSDRGTMMVLRQEGRGCNISNINQKILSSLPIILPPLPLQQSFASKIEAIEHQKALIQQSIAEVQMLFDSRMDDWFA